MEQIIKEHIGGNVLHLGRVNSFTPNELNSFWSSQGMIYLDSYSGEEISLLILSSMLNPMEEELSYTLYDMGVPDISIAEFEKLYASYIKPNSLMMSLKLSGDQERLIRQLKNESFDDKLYLKLFEMYDWGGVGIYDSDTNRDVTVTFMKRFFRPTTHYDPTAIYSPQTLIPTVRDSRDSDMLHAVLSMPEHQIKQSKKETLRPQSLREIVARNEYISQQSIRKLLSYNSSRIERLLAYNSATDCQTQKRILTSSDHMTRLMLSQNSNLCDELFEELLHSNDEQTIASLLSYQSMTHHRLDMIELAKVDSDIWALLGNNIEITPVIDRLILHDEALDRNLAQNSSIDDSYLLQLYSRYGVDIAPFISANINLREDIIRQIYSSADRETLLNLAANSSTPEDILEELHHTQEIETLMRLATNPSLKLKYLEEYALDSRLIKQMENNRRYLESIEIR